MEVRALLGRSRGVLALATVGAIALIVATVGDRSAAWWFVPGLLATPWVVRALRGRPAPHEVVATWFGRRAIRITPGWTTGVGTDGGGIILAVRGPARLHGWACEVHGPTGAFVAVEPDDDPAEPDAQRSAVFRFPSDFDPVGDQAAASRPPPPGTYHALWWAWDEDGRRLCVGRSRFRLPKPPAGRVPPSGG